MKKQNILTHTPQYQNRKSHDVKTSWLFAWSEWVNIPQYYTLLLQHTQNKNRQ
jgi:hypothetical protein